MKKIFLSLLLGLFGLIGFSNAGSVSYSAVVPAGSYNKTILYSFPLPLNNLQGGIGTVNCIFTGIDGTYTQDKQFDFSFYMVDRGNPDIGVNYGSLFAGYVKFSSFFSNSTYNYNYNHTNNYVYESNKYFVSFAFRSYYSFTLNSDLYISCTLSGDNVLGGSCPECETCPEVNTGDILSGSCDTNYCVENDLCPVPGNFSQLFINDLEFPGKPLINVNIPDYIHWDYSSNETGFDLYVGSGYDQDYIDSVLKINSYRPNSSDFTNIFVSGLTLIFPYLIFALFIVFMRKLLKRIFKH